MTLPKKARNIIIDNENYKWLLLRSEPWPSFIAEKEGTKSSLIMHIPWIMQELDFGGNRINNGEISPADIEICIRTAMSNGWDPEQQGTFRYNK
jgi:hypothetical protein